jgi:hypothetical protein
MTVPLVERGSPAVPMMPNDLLVVITPNAFDHPETHWSRLAALRRQWDVRLAT